MKTTIEIPDSVLREARKMAARRGTTLRALVEQGLRSILAESKRQGSKPFKFRPVVVTGEGFQPEFEDADWAKIRDAIYEGRGA